MSDQLWINTYTGKKFYPLSPRVEDICIEDIAHALSMQCRFTGHIKRFYSVAQHSLEVCHLVPQEDKLWGLLHDAAEAYLVDLARPVKHAEGMETYRRAEHELMHAIAARFELPSTPGRKQPTSVTDADHRMLIIEAHQLVPNRHPDWLIDWQHLDAGHNPYERTLTPYPPETIELMFLNRFYNLTREAA